MSKIFLLIKKIKAPNIEKIKILDVVINGSARNKKNNIKKSKTKSAKIVIKGFK
tara:strand:+ start:963 stop:1124 length:162 start_codon:yes stop_codon:yes gene_type:complete